MVSARHYECPTTNREFADAPQEPVQEAKEKELYNAFTVLGSDPELTEVRFASPAQAEAALRGQFLRLLERLPAR